MNITVILNVKIDENIFHYTALFTNGVFDV